MSVIIIEEKKLQKISQRITVYTSTLRNYVLVIPRPEGVYRKYPQECVDNPEGAARGIINTFLRVFPGNPALYVV